MFEDEEADDIDPLFSDRLLRDTTPLQRGIIRHLVLLLDLSSAMSEKDLRPTRYILTLRTTIDFIKDFFEQNPISQLAIIDMRDGLSHRLSEMSGNPAIHTAALQKLLEDVATNPTQPSANGVVSELDTGPRGSPSLQNGLELARAGLAATPSHGTREILIVFGALLSADPGDIHNTIRNLINDHVRVCVVGLAARLAICSELVAKTHGLASIDSASSAPTTAGTSPDLLYGVALHEQHFRQLLLTHTTPPATRAAEQASRAPSLLVMGFPSRIDENHPTLCACHAQPSRGGYLCTRCSAKVCSLPAQCPTCGLQLVQSTHLARSFHHLFPLKNYREVSWNEARRDAVKKGWDRCFSCLAEFPAIPDRAVQNGVNGSAARRPSAGRLAVRSEIAKKRAAGASESSRYACTSCGQHFCIECDVYAHEVVHNCGGCLCDVDVGGTERNDAKNGEIEDD